MLAWYFITHYAALQLPVRKRLTSPAVLLYGIVGCNRSHHCDAAHRRPRGSGHAGGADSQPLGPPPRPPTAEIRMTALAANCCTATASIATSRSRASVTRAPVIAKTKRWNNTNAESKLVSTVRPKAWPATELFGGASFERGGSIARHET